MRAKVEFRCQFCLDPIPVIVKAGVRSKLRQGDAGECKFCRETRDDMEPEAFMRVILRPGKIAPQKFWLIWARRGSNLKEIHEASTVKAEHRDAMPQAAE